MRLKTALCSGSFPSKKPFGKLCAFQENLQDIGKMIGQLACNQNIKEQLSEKSLIKTVFLDDDGRCERLNSPR